MKKTFTYTVLVITGLIFTQSLQTAFASTGGIVAGFDTTKVCHDSTCTTPTPGTLNFRPTGATAVVVDDVTGLSGDIWGDELGWITLNPTGQGVTFANPATGLLTGKAWSQMSGWINFAPTGQTVTISPSTGEFSGWAWTGGPYGGWIKFDCAGVGTCVKTDWTGASSGGVVGGGASYTRNVCANLEGSQMAIPQGYTVDQNGFCVFIIDVCPNLIGDQSIVPRGFEKDTIGACVIPTKEPSTGETVIVDYCPNIFGVQLSIPPKMYVNDKGECATLPVDRCSNLGGYQSVVPEGYTLQGEACFFSFQSTSPHSDKAPVIGFSFIQKSWQIPSDNPLLKSVVKSVVSPDNTQGEFKVDITSLGAVFLGLFVILFRVIVWIKNRILS